MSFSHGNTLSDLPELRRSRLILSIRESSAREPLAEASSIKAESLAPASVCSYRPELESTFDISEISGSVEI